MHSAWKIIRHERHPSVAQDYLWKCSFIGLKKVGGKRSKCDSGNWQYLHVELRFPLSVTHFPVCTSLTHMVPNEVQQGMFFAISADQVALTARAALAACSAPRCPRNGLQGWWTSTKHPAGLSETQRRRRWRCHSALNSPWVRFVHSSPLQPWCEWKSPRWANR